MEAIKFLLGNQHDRLAAMDLVYLREDNRQSLGDVLAPEHEPLYQRLIEKYELAHFQSNYSIESERLFSNTIRIVNDLGDMLSGIYFEIILHDVRNPLRSIIAIKNSEEVSQRRMHGPSTRFVVQYVKHQGRHLIDAMESGSKVAYPKQFTTTRKVKATTTPIFDARYGLVGILCFNIDIAAVNAMTTKRKKRFFESYSRTFGETPKFEKNDAPED